MLKVVVDTSIFIAGLLTKNALSSSNQVLEMWRAGAFTLVMSPQIMRELVAKLIQLGIAEEIITELVAVLGKLALRIPGSYEVTQMDNIDPADNKFLAAALESQADFLVSLDKQHLLPMKYYHGTQILAPHLFIRQLIQPATKEEEEEAAYETGMRMLEKEIAQKWSET